jgi:hypothetical protein
VGIDVDAEPQAVRKAFFKVVKNIFLPVRLFLKSEVELKQKLQSFLNNITYNLTAIKSAE